MGVPENVGRDNLPHINIALYRVERTHEQKNAVLCCLSITYAIVIHMETIPTIIHQTWKESSVPHDVYRREWIESWHTHHPSWHFMFWTDADNRELVQRHCPWFLETYDALPTGVCRADAARYLYMHAYGGVYVDLDCECFKSVEPLLEGDVVLGRLNSDPTFHHAIPNAFLASVPGHPFWVELIEEVQRRFRTNQFASVEELCGPILLTQKVKQERDRFSITIHPSRYIYPVSWQEQEIVYERMLRDTKKRYPEAYMATYWMKNWKDPTGPLSSPLTCKI